MTDTEQRIAIARWMGWTVITSDAVGRPPWSDRHGADDQKVSDYTRDLNAIYDAETRLLAKYRHAAYLEELCNVCRPDGAEPESIDDLINAIRATAAQRAEALLRTLNLWTDDVPETTTAPSGAQTERQ